MEKHLLINELTGQWIIQSTNCSLPNHSIAKNTLINKVKWTNIKHYSSYLKSVTENLKKHKKLSSAKLYCIESKNNSASSNKHYILLIYQASTLKSIIKLSHSLSILNKFVVRSQSYNHLTIVSCDKNIETREKIYFLNRNLKVIKSTIRKHNKYIGAAFSSEIRID